jgi:hypothetical protein
MLYRNTAVLDKILKTVKPNEPPLPRTGEQPVKTEEELLDIEIKLTNDPVFRKQFVSIASK